MQDNMNEKDIAKRATSMAKEMILERKSPNEIRDSFAGKAMTGLLSGSTLDDKDVPKEAYEIADEILK